MLEQTLRMVAKELSGANALEFTKRLTHFHRDPGSRGYHDAVDCVEAMLRESGIEDIARHRVRLAEGVKYWKWDLGQRCYQDEARLELVEPSSELLLDTHSSPICIARGSQSTPASGEQAELVDVGSGDRPECYQGKNVAGKVVLAQGKPDVVATLAIQERGALGVLNGILLMELPPLRTREEYPDLIQWQGLSKANKSPDTARGWGFAISHTMVLRLKELLSKGKVVVRAVVKGEWRDSHFDNIIATVPGEEPEGRQFWFVAHLCHPAPSAGDNASGCGLMVEIARTLTALIAQGVIARPRVDVKFLFCPEMTGSLAYVHDHLSEMQNSLGGFCLDMVGHDQAKTGSSLLVTRAPDSLPSIISDVTAGFFEMQEQPKQFWKIGGQGQFKYVVSPYVGLSDHYNFCDADVGVPMICFIHWPDIYYHTSHDTIDKMSPNTFSVVGNTAASVALALCQPTEAGLRQMLELSAGAAVRRIQELAESARCRAERALSQDRHGEAARILAAVQVDLEMAIEVESRVLRQVLDALPIDFDRSRLESYLILLEQSLNQQAEAQKTRILFLARPLPEVPAVSVGYSPVPRRLCQGPLDYTDFFSTTTPEDFESLVLASELWNCMDGRQRLDEIERLLRLEYGPIEEGRLDQLLDRMVELGYAVV